MFNIEKSRLSRKMLFNIMNVKNQNRTWIRNNADPNGILVQILGQKMEKNFHCYTYFT